MISAPACSAAIAAKRARDLLLTSALSPLRSRPEPSVRRLPQFACIAACAGFVGLTRTATRDNLGAIARSISRCLATRSPARLNRPVMLPPGCARLLTNPAATGSPDTTMTMGIFVVAFCAASAPGGPECQDHIHRHLHQLGGHRGKTVVVTVGEPPFDDQIPPFDVAELAHPAREGAVVVGVERGWTAARRKDADATERARRLRERPHRRRERNPGECEDQLAASSHGEPGSSRSACRAPRPPSRTAARDRSRRERRRARGRRAPAA